MKSLLTTQNFSNYILKNHLYQYKGGGYDGCFWEWNFFMFDKNGNFINIFSSGYAGIKNKNQAIELIKNNKIEYRYNLESNKQMLQFGNENVAGVVKMIQDFFNNNDIDIKLICNCKICNNEIYVNNAIATDPSSDGGIVVTNKSFICEDCYFDHSCPNCSNFGKNLELYHLDNNTKCECCIKDTDILENIEYFLRYPSNDILEKTIELLNNNDIDINLKNIRLDLIDIDIISQIENNDIKKTFIEKREYQLNYYNKNQLSLNFEY